MSFCRHHKVFMGSRDGGVIMGTMPSFVWREPGHCTMRYVTRQIPSKSSLTFFLLDLVDIEAT